MAADVRIRDVKTFPVAPARSMQQEGREREVVV
jgi:hypothetical protein